MQKSTLLKKPWSNLKFIDVSKLNLNDLKAAVTFKDGKVNVKPFHQIQRSDYRWRDIALIKL
jgi:hypothetical protein